MGSVGQKDGFFLRRPDELVALIRAFYNNIGQFLSRHVKINERRSMMNTRVFVCQPLMTASVEVLEEFRYLFHILIQLSTECIFSCHAHSHFLLPANFSRLQTLEPGKAVQNAVFLAAFSLRD